MVFALSISPGVEQYVPEAEAMVAKAKEMISYYIQLLVDEFGTEEMSAATPEDTLDEKARKREERKKRMAAYNSGEKPE